jgi:tRNA A-37 threonylcarbamoyl transferase component Bud32
MTGGKTEDGDKGPSDPRTEPATPEAESEQSDCRPRSQGESGSRETETGAEGAGVPWFEGSVMMGADSLKPPPPAEPGGGQGPQPPSTPGRPWLSDRGEMACGGMSAIHDAFDNNLRRRIAMKVLHPALGRDTTNRLRFVEEAQITGQLDHPNIPPVYDFWISDSGEVRFTMKMVKGKTLKQILCENPPGERSDEELESLLKIFIKVCDAVSFAHSRGVIHRDLKTENVMVGSHGQVWVMDWGFALLAPAVRNAESERVSIARDPAGDSLDPPNTAIGTVAYMAPEQALGQNDRLDQRTDIYLLGGILYEILTGFPPHLADSVVEALKRAQNGMVEDPQQKLGEVKAPPDLCRIARRALQPDPARRYQSVERLEEEIEWSLRNGFWFSSVTFPAGAVVFRENEPGDRAYIITGGSCEAFRVENGRRVCLRRMDKGDAFGEAAIFSGRPRSASVQVIEEMTAVVVTRESFERAMGGTSWMGFFVRALAGRFLELDERLAHLRKLERDEEK